MYCRVSKTLDLIDGQFMKAFEFLREDFLEILKDIPPTLKNAIIEVYDHVQAFTSLMMKELNEVRKMVLQGISTFLAQAFQVTKQMVLDVYRVVIKPAVQYIQRYLIEPLRLVIQKLIELRVQIRDTFHYMIAQTGHITLDSIDVVLSGVDQALEVMPQSLNVALEEMTNAINQVNQETISSVNRVSGGIYDTAQNSVNTALTAAEAMISTVTDNAEGMVNSSIGQVEGEINSTVKEINTTIGTIDNLIKTVMGSFNSVVNGWNKMRDFKLSEKFKVPVIDKDITIDFGKPLSFIPKLPTLGASNGQGRHRRILRDNLPYDLTADVRKGYKFKLPGIKGFSAGSQYEMVVLRIDRRDLTVTDFATYKTFQEDLEMERHEWLIIGAILGDVCTIKFVMASDSVFGKEGRDSTRMLIIPRDAKIRPLFSVDKKSREIIFTHGTVTAATHGAIRVFYDLDTNYPTRIDLGMNALNAKPCSDPHYFIDVDNNVYNLEPLGASSSRCQETTQYIAKTGPIDIDHWTKYPVFAKNFTGGITRVQECVGKLNADVAEVLNSPGRMCDIVAEMMEQFNTDFLRQAIQEGYGTLMPALKYGISTAQIEQHAYNLALLVSLPKGEVLKCMDMTPEQREMMKRTLLPRIPTVKIPRTTMPRVNKLLPRLDFTDEKKEAQIPPSSGNIRAPKIPDPKIGVHDPVMNGIQTVIGHIRTIYASLLDPIKDAITSIMTLILEVYRTCRRFLQTYTTLSGLSQVIPENGFGPDVSEEQLAAAVEAVISESDDPLRNVPEPDITWGELFRRITSGVWGQIVFAFKEHVVPAFLWLVVTI